MPAAIPHKFSRRYFFRLFAGSALGATAFGGGGMVYAVRLEPGWLDITRVTLQLPHLAPEFDGYRIVQLSDLHFDNVWMDEARLSAIVEQVNDLLSDVVVITGDFVTEFPVDVLEAPLAGALRRLDGIPDGKLAVLGNHDYWTDPALVRRVLAGSGIRDISNRVHTIRRGEAALHIAGVDDVWEHKARLDDVLAQLPDKGAAVLLAHEPDFADTSAATGRFDLQLSGHSHGGQVVVPFVGPPRLPPLGRKYPSGLYRVGGMFQYTNRGVGMVAPRLRFNCRPEVTVLTLQAPQPQPYTDPV